MIEEKTAKAECAVPGLKPEEWLARPGWRPGLFAERAEPLTRDDVCWRLQLRVQVKALLHGFGRLCGRRTVTEKVE
jgi:hypothetical protein